jgi:predicted GNAT family N-acyltransferase
MNKYYELSYRLTKDLSSEVDLLRMLAFPGKNYSITSKDKFDDTCLHVSIELNGDTAAYARLTSGPNSVFYTWTNGKSSLPNDKDTIDLGRVLVNPKYRGLGLFNWILIEACILSKKLGYAKINGTYIPTQDHIKKSIHSLGFCDCGDTVNEFESGGISVLVQPVSCNITTDIFHSWITKKHDIEINFHKKINILIPIFLIISFYEL